MHSFSIGEEIGHFSIGTSSCEPVFRYPSRPSTDVELAAVAVLPLGSGNDLDICRRLELTDAAHHLAKNRDFLIELIFVIRVLVVASPAGSEIRAARLDTRRRRLFYREEPGMQLVLPLHHGLLARQNEGSQDDTSIDARETFAAVYQLFDRDEVGHCTMGFVRPT